ncbi:PAS domain-containing protein, partial [Natronoarchaeum mannanilyticum]|uniref:PAS domain-containing protein n=1 Tax=Natronoarchaeum mannanilyticum TaxID=926360 RepID=UPI00360FE514
MTEGGGSAGSTVPEDSHDGVTIERYRTLVDAVDDGLFQLDAEATIVDANDAIVMAVGRRRDELVGEHVAAILGD